MQRAVPLSHHHVHPRLAAPVRGDIEGFAVEITFWPALRGVPIHGQGHVFCPGEGRRSRSDEKEAGIGGPEEERDECRGHDLGAGGINVPGLVPHLALCHFATGELVVKLCA